MKIVYDIREKKMCGGQLRIWCIKIGIVLVLHFNWVEASAGGL
jgi:hypothetical protein